jgi:radical SAM protein with 4Fe4S-binding SPASM domain
MVAKLMADLEEARARFDTLVLYWLGEPLLHPDFTTIYQDVLRRNELGRVFGRIEVHTNATRLAERGWRVAVNRAHTEQIWYFSLDAARSATWRILKTGSNSAFTPGTSFRAVERSIERMLRWKSETGAPNPRLVLQFVLSNRNIDEAAHFRFRWERAFRSAGLKVVSAAGHVPPGRDDVVFFKQPDCDTPEELLAQNRIFRAGAAALGLSTVEMDVPAACAAVRTPIGPCSGHWKSPVVGWDGQVTVCTQDSSFQIKLGSLLEQPFTELWWGSDATARRRAVASGDLASVPLCRECSVPVSMRHPRLSKVELQRQRQWDDERWPTPQEKPPALPL